MLEIYGLYKQATAGDNTTSQPWAIQLEAAAKWNAWTALKGTLSRSLGAMEGILSLIHDCPC